MGDARELAGLVLAAGAGRRMGRPKALMRNDDGTPWLRLAHEALRGAGCSSVTIVLGARADEARDLAPADALLVVAADWELGMSASLRTGLAAVAATGATGVLVTLVDLPGMPVEVARRVADGFDGAPALRQAVFAGRPGHPALIGRDHWPALAASLEGDRGARAYLASHGATEVECGDLWAGLDVDHPG